MTPDRQVLIEGFLDATLDEDGLRRVREFAAADAGFRRDLVGALRMHGRLRNAVHPDAGCEQLASLVGRAVGAVPSSERRFTARVMHQIPSRRRRSRQVWPAWALRRSVLAAAAAILVAVAGYALFASTGSRGRNLSVAEIDEVQGDATWSGPDGVRHKAFSGQRLAAGGKLETGASAHLSLRWFRSALADPAGAPEFEATRVQLDPEAVLGLEVGADGGKGMRLERGGIRCEAAKQPAGQPLRIRTPQAETMVVGTRFVLSARSGSTRLRVDEGLVRLIAAADGRNLDVTAGASAVVADKVCFASRPVPGPVTEGLIALYTFGEGAGDIIHDISGAGEPADLRIADPGATAWLPGGGLAIRRPVVIRSLAAVGRLTAAINRTGSATMLVRVVGEGSGAMAAVHLVGIKTNSHTNFGLNVTMDPGEPHEVVMTCDLRKGLFNAYHDGSKSGTPQDRAVGSLFPLRDDMLLYLGGLEAGNLKAIQLQPFRGEIRLVAIYDRVLGDDEIARCHQAAAPTVP